MGHLHENSRAKKDIEFDWKDMALGSLTTPLGKHRKTNLLSKGLGYLI